MREHFGLPCVVSVNHFTHDTDAELALLQQKMAPLGAPVVMRPPLGAGQCGAENLAHQVVKLAAQGSPGFRFTYQDSDSLWEKMKAIATKIYGAADISADAKIRAPDQQASG